MQSKVLAVKTGLTKTDELNDEEQIMKVNIELLISRLEDESDSIALLAIDSLTNLLQEATSSMVSVPLVLKVVRGHFDQLEKIYENAELPSSIKMKLANILSVLCSTFPDNNRKALKYLLAGNFTELIKWGHEYVQYISTQIVAEYEFRREQFLNTEFQQNLSHENIENFTIEDLLEIVFQIIDFYMRHRNEVDAVDLLLELKQIEQIVQYTDSKNYLKVTQYLIAYADYTVVAEEYAKVLIVAYDIFAKLNLWCEAGRIAIKLNSKERLLQAYEKCEETLMKTQFCYILMDLNCNMLNANELNPNNNSELNYIISKKHLTKYYNYIAKELEVEEPKLPEDVYKSRCQSHSVIQPLKEAISSFIVNGFVNMGFGKDLLVTKDANWLTQNKEQSLLLAVASLGLICKWDVELCLKELNKHKSSSDIYINAGLNMALGLAASGLEINEFTSPFSLSYTEKATLTEKIGSILGIAFAYPNSQKEEYLEMLVPLIIDLDLSIEISAFSALALGMIYMASANEAVIEVLIQTLKDRCNDNKKIHPLCFFFGISLGLICLGKKAECDPIIDILNEELLNTHPVVQYTSICVESFAYAGSGDVTKVQRFLRICTKNIQQNNTEYQYSVQPNNKEESHLTPSNIPSAAAVLALPLVALGEGIGMDMILRLLDHLLQYGKGHARAAVPLALALLSPSNPKSMIIDVLSRLSHEPNYEVCVLAILALGIVGAGTNHARIADILQQLTKIYKQNESKMYFIRLSQGFLYMGKGLLTLSPFQSDHLLLNYKSLGSLLVVIHTALFFRLTLEKSNAYLFNFLAVAARPHHLITLGDDLNPLSVIVRVGQAVDTTGQAGNPRTITSFQTHNTPVLLADTDRAELGSNDYNPITSVPLEGIIIMRKK